MKLKVRKCMLALVLPILLVIVGAFHSVFAVGSPSKFPTQEQHILIRQNPKVGSGGTSAMGVLKSKLFSLFNWTSINKEDACRKFVKFTSNANPFSFTEVVPLLRSSNTLQMLVLEYDYSGGDMETLFSHLSTINGNASVDEICNDKVGQIVNGMFDGISDAQMMDFAWQIALEYEIKRVWFDYKTYKWDNAPMSPQLWFDILAKAFNINKLPSPKEMMAIFASVSKGSPGNILPSGVGKQNKNSIQRKIDCLNNAKTAVSILGGGGDGVTDPVSYPVPDDIMPPGKFGPTDKPIQKQPGSYGDGGYASIFGGCYGLDPSMVPGFGKGKPGKWSGSGELCFMDYCFSSAKVMSKKYEAAKEVTMHYGARIYIDTGGKAEVDGKEVPVVYEYASVYILELDGTYYVYVRDPVNGLGGYYEAHDKGDAMTVADETVKKYIEEALHDKDEGENVRVEEKKEAVHLKSGGSDGGGGSLQGPDSDDYSPCNMTAGYAALLCMIGGGSYGNDESCGPLGKVAPVALPVPDNPYHDRGCRDLSEPLFKPHPGVLVTDPPPFNTKPVDTSKLRDGVLENKMLNNIDLDKKDTGGNNMVNGVSGHYNYKGTLPHKLNDKDNIQLPPLDIFRKYMGRGIMQINPPASGK